jgi:hypothetical protein
MGSFQRIFAKIFLVINTIADWFLILSGLVLICWALLTVDVVEARYLLSTIGVLLFGSGCWFRRLSLKKRFPQK